MIEAILTILELIEPSLPEPSRPSLIIIKLLLTSIGHYSAPNCAAHCLY